MGKTKFAKKSDKPQLFGVFRKRDFKQRMKVGSVIRSVSKGARIEEGEVRDFMFS
jgi:hypothetical protein